VIFKSDMEGRAQVIAKSLTAIDAYIVMRICQRLNTHCTLYESIAWVLSADGCENSLPCCAGARLTAGAADKPGRGNYRGELHMQIRVWSK